jgi:two-component system response regulator YesN
MHVYQQKDGMDIRERIGWEILHLRNLVEWEEWSEANFNLLLEAAADNRYKNLPPPLLKAMDYIQEHYKEDLNRNRVAAAALVSPVHLSRLFSEKLNTSFSHYLTNLRIDTAEKLLRETKLSVKEISFETGFQDPDYFGKVFKKMKGDLPNDIRRK